MTIMKQAMAQQIIHLMKKSHVPKVVIAKSSISGKNQAGAGRGVFARCDVSAEEVPMVMCLYPGVYTPGLPMGCAECEYLANQTPPSNYGSAIDENAYILNLALMGGYIDGCALESQFDGKEALDGNPSACGHLINHDVAMKNIDVIAFAWDEVNGLDDAFIDNADESSSSYSVPNELRTDASPWYYDTLLDDLVSFPGKGQTSPPRSMLCGAAMVLTAPILQGKELLLDYGLKEPYPTWAREWYQGSSTK